MHGWPRTSLILVSLGLVAALCFALRDPPPPPDRPAASPPVVRPRQTAPAPEHAPAATERTEVPPPRSAADAPAGPKVQGRVVAQDNRGIAGAKVLARPRAAPARPEPPAQGALTPLVDALLERVPIDRASAICDEQGKFSIELSGPGKYVFTGSHADHPSASVEVELAPAQQRGETLIVLPTGATVHGRAVDVPRGTTVEVTATVEGHSRTPGVLSEAMALLPESPGTRAAAVAADGTFELRGLTADAFYGVALRLPNAPFGSPCSEPVVVRAPARGVTLRFDAPLVVTCRPVDATSGLPLGTLDVHATLVRRGQAMNVANRETVLPLGSHRTKDGVLRVELRPQADDTHLRLSFATANHRAHQPAPIELRGQRLVDLGTLALYAPPRLRLRVLHSLTQRPEPGVAVELVAPLAGAARHPRAGRTFERHLAAAGSTDADGRLDMELREGSKGLVRLRKAGFAQVDVPIDDLPTSGMVEHTLQLLVGNRLELRVLDARAQPMPGARITARRQRDGQTELWVCDASGRATIENLLPDRYTLGFENEGHDEITLGVGDGGHTEFVLRKSQPR